MPGFNFPDPFARVNPFAGEDDQPTAMRPPKAVYRQPLPADEFASFGKKALDAGTSGIGYVLGSLDKPGQAVRGVLAGHGASALKNLIPFSDTMGLTTDADKVSGRDLTNMAGITSKNDKGWGAWGAGLAADIGTDPLSYLTLGAKSALTPAGAALRNQGLLKGMSRADLLKGFEDTVPNMMSKGASASEVEHAISQGRRIASQGAVDVASKAGQEILPGQALSSLGRINVPFGPKYNVGTGELAQKVAGGLDTAGDWLRFGNPVGRAAGSLFDRSVRGATDAVTQRAAAKYGTPLADSFEQQQRAHNSGLLEKLNPVIASGIAPERAVTEAARGVAEGAGFMADPALANAVRPAADQIKTANARYLADAQQAGLPLKNAGDKFIDYVHRQNLDVNHRDLQLGGSKPSQSFFPVTSGSDIGRKDVFRDIPGGGNRINDWMSRFAGDRTRQAIQQNSGTIRSELEADLLASGRQMTPEIAKAFDAKAGDIAQRASSASPNYRPTADNPAGLPFYTPDIVATEAQRAKQHASSMTSAATAVGAIGDVAQKFRNDGSMIPVQRVIRRLGLTNKGFDDKTGELAHGALVQVYKALAPKGAANVDTLAQMTNKQIVREVGKFGVSNEHAGQILKQYAKAQAPEQMKSSLSALDSFTNAFKALAYPVWIPSHVRNLTTGLANNATKGTGFGDYFDQLKAMTGRGKINPTRFGPALSGVPVGQEADALRKAQYISAGIFGGHDATNEIAGGARDALENLAVGAGPGRFTPAVPGTPSGSGSVAKDAYDTVVKQGLLGSLKASGQTAANAIKDPMAFAPWNFGSGRAGQVFSPLGIRGVNGAAADSLPAVAAGRKIGTQIENFLRGAQWNHHVKSGMSPEMAAQEIEKLHFNYDHLSDFEKNVMRRAVPFYTFMRKNLPLQASNIVSRPGVFNAQYKPFNQKTPGEDGYVPKYMASGVSIPLGPEVDGKRQYISKLGLPAEEAFERLHFKNGLPDVRSTAMDFMGALNPIIKAPLEQLFNTQFHTQRKLTDLQAPQSASAIGKLFGDDNPQILSQILANSPLTRFVTSADKLMDPRKSMIQKAANMLTGVRVTDVDADKQRAIELRQAVEDMMEGHPRLSKYTRRFVKPEDAASLTPEEIAVMRVYNQLGDQARAYAKTKKDQIGIKP